MQKQWHENIDHGQNSNAAGRFMKRTSAVSVIYTASSKGRLFFGFPDQDESDSSIGE